MLRQPAHAILATAFLILAVALPTANFSAAQDFALQPPDYRSARYVGRHIAFSMILSMLIKNAYDASPPQACELGEAFVRVPNLRFLFNVFPHEGSWAGCLRRIEQLLRNTEFDQTAFNAAFRSAQQTFAPRAPNDAVYSNPAPRLQYGRLGLLGVLALKQLYPNDPVLVPILDHYGWVFAERDNFAAFAS